MVGFFALFHGRAHGTELSPGSSGVLYSIGFVIATGTLHGCGITLGLINRWQRRSMLIRTAGTVVADGYVFFSGGFSHEHSATGSSLDAFTLAGGSIFIPTSACMLIWI